MLLIVKNDTWAKPKPTGKFNALRDIDTANTSADKIMSLTMN
jgi:hypothetical protein